MKSTHPAHARPQLLCFSHLRWDFVYQRPQHLLSRAAEHYDVLFLEEPVVGPVEAPAIEMRKRGAVAVAVPVLPEGTTEAQAAPMIRGLLEPFLQIPCPSRVLWYYTPMAMAFSEDIAADVVVYDNMDELSAFLGASSPLLALEDALFARADLVFTGGMSLYAAKRDRHPRVYAFPSSVDASHFASARRADRVEPIDQASIPHPRIGFFGVIDERMDIDLVAELARRQPDWQFVIVGPVVKIEPAILPRTANLHWLGGRGYEALPDYIGGWDAGFMPFARNDATRFISPTKTPEFLAAGVPVVSTSIVDVVKPYGENGLVEIADDAADVETALELLLERPREAWLRAVDAHLATMSWDITWAAMHELITEMKPAKRRSGAGSPETVPASAHL